MTTDSNKHNKLQKLISVYEHFGREINAIPDPWASKLAKQSNTVRADVESIVGKKPGVTKSQCAAGLEQGIRDIPDFIAMISPEWRAQVAKALNLAIQTAYPEFIAKDTKRLEKVRTRGKIKTESEYYLIRHKIDLLEETSDLYLLAELYMLADSCGSKV